MEMETNQSTKKRPRDNESPSLDLTRRIQIKECYAIEYKDKKMTSAGWHKGQLTYYKTDRKATLFGAKNVKLTECYNVVLEAEMKKNDKQKANKSVKEENEDEEKKKQENRLDINSILSKEPTLPEGAEITLDDQFLVRICNNKFVKHDQYKPAGEDPQKALMRKRIRAFIDGQEDIFGGSLPIRKVLPLSQKACTPPPSSQKHSQTVHSHLATVLSESHPQTVHSHIATIAAGTSDPPTTSQKSTQTVHSHLATVSLDAPSSDTLT